MVPLHKHMIYNHESQPLPPIKNPQTQPPLLPTSHNSSFPILPIAILCIFATAFLLVIYYILLAKCCFTWQQLDPLRRFSLPRRPPPPPTDDPLAANSPSSHGLDEFLIREIPTFQYRKIQSRDREEFIYKCIVCLSEFQEQDVLRVLPKCGHGFHLDCIDIWLQSNANCPLCRTSISGETRCLIDRIVAPNSSPQEPFDALLGGDDDFVVIELTNGIRERSEQREVGRKFDELIKIGNVKKQGKFRRVSIMGDECIDAMREKDDRFCVQPMRRSFSLDSAADPHVYLAVQEIIRQSESQSEVRSRGESSSRGRRQFFPFGNGRGSRSAVLPVEF
ncbi:hypothetical protein RHGRI_035837 [Rhododendron griersonianum]|uniref:RING-type E3 ubiquitin transferase n=1 Tax=Rhododendron griersonianum TaxID=479676 RepID=A0AAV6HP74_9ERIC|nr:hypothetical protein RHGRI_035837 [Rhododendron griersonianum]